MCLVVLAIHRHPDYPLILAANRDEFHARPAREAHWWQDRPHVFGGRDLQAGGTWLAISRNGRFATVTNYQDAKPSTPDSRSRGYLVTDFLDGDLAPRDYLATIEQGEYSGFNLIVGTPDDVGYLSNRGDGTRALGPGLYGLSNALLDGPWYKVERTRDRLETLLDAGDISETSLMRLMGDRERAPVERVVRGNLDFERAHAISAPFIVTPDYGTRCTSVILADKDGGWRFLERRFDASGGAIGEIQAAASPE
jgi:uncharacterized protein with NRDE domain